MNAYEIPEDALELTADVVRLARAATPGTRAEHILADMKRMHPDVSEQDIRRSFGFAAAMLERQHQP